ncbi:MAG: ribbon-helix-helix protein, CopG family [Candidatus Saccharibacteria bacterium]|nr:ribbon-helix-helix protein, CopG family [Candidatus Saccharibacteria bacterium]
MTKKTTLYLDPSLYKGIKLRAVETGQSVSALMNEALRDQLSEDLSDITSIRNRLAKKDKPLTYDQALSELKRDGLI